MIETFHIQDESLPESQDFNLLKEKGLSFIQSHSGNQWTNLNPSDPGVTILDQLCYALTELGYCNAFSIADILTDSNENLNVENQFYLPTEILTTSSVTTIDYAKYIIDGVDGVENAFVCSSKLKNLFSDNTYQAYLLIDPSITDQDIIKSICREADNLLNRARNLCEMFLPTIKLKPKKYLLDGKIIIEKETDLKQILLEFQNKIRNYVYPKVAQKGYNELEKLGLNINTICNGPFLKNGWIQNSDLGQKRKAIRLVEVNQIMASIPGVIASQIKFFSETFELGNDIIDLTDIAQSQLQQIITFDITNSLNPLYPKKIPSHKSLESTLHVICNKKHIDSTILNSAIENLNRFDKIKSDEQSVSAKNLSPDLPKGKYRDINSYYSIQNTFPEIFSVGADTINTNASDYKIAQSRQLKGYLTLFDQILANQFSQLANIDKLFSFKNSTTASPSDLQNFYKTKDKFQQEHLEYPVPYKTFSPTYFYQSLYEVPHIKPLLKNNETFNFSTEIESQKLLDNKSWDSYKEDPYNPYIWGLKKIMEDDRLNYERRNILIDHLLARHGESPVIIDEIIDGLGYSADILKNRIITKSLLLQNLGLLSYFRQKGYNYLGSKNLRRNLKNFNKKLEKVYYRRFTNDFIFESNEVDALEKLTVSDFNNYSAIELKLSLLLGLKATYHDFIVEICNELTAIKNLNSQSRSSLVNDLKLALWMIYERKGSFMIESNLLKKHIKTPLKNNRMLVVLPDFIPELKSPAFKKKLKVFLDYELPINIDHKIHYLSEANLKIFIKNFVCWHNTLGSVDQNDKHHKNRKCSDDVSVYASKLINQLINSKKEKG